jgi:phage shock protein A
MGIFSRFSDIINSNINALLDKAEDPEKMVRLIIQEMEETLVEVRTTSAKAIADKKELSRRKSGLLAQIGDWEQKAELAISKGREDLARGALAEKLKLTEAIEMADQELQQLESSLQTLEEEITQLQQKLTEAKARQSSLVIRHKTAASQINVRMKTQAGNTQDTLAKLEQYERKLDDLESQVESYDMGQQSLSDQIEQLAKDDEIEQQLESLKQRLNNKTQENLDNQ